jgi:hypothetical protein
MSSNDRRAAGRRRAWGRGPVILKFEPLERRELLSTAANMALPDLVTSSFVTSHNADWNEDITASGTITNKGRGAVTTSFNVGIYASHNGTVGPYSVLLGEVNIPAGLAPGQSVPFTTTVKLPTAPPPGVKTNGTVYIDAKVDPEKLVPESNRRNNAPHGRGPGSSIVQIAPAQPSQLVATAVGIYPASPEWGGTLSVTTQISNKSYGDAPATLAQVVLTPAGVVPGGVNDVTIGTISIPPIAAWSKVNVEGNIQLPAVVPTLLTGTTQYVLSVLPDASYATNPVYPHVPVGGIGVDQASVSITQPAGVTPPAMGPVSDLAAGTVKIAGSSLNWGQSFQAEATIQNLGQIDPGPFLVRFLLVGGNGDATHGLYLGDAVVKSLTPGNATVITQNLSLPSRLPAGVTLGSITVGRIAAVVDPQNLLNETFKNNNSTVSAPISLRVLGTDGSSTVPNLPAPGELLAVNASTVTSTSAANARTAVGRRSPQAKRPYRKPPPDDSLLHKLTVFPQQVNDLIKKYI